ncbi:MAG: OadG family protein [Clostridia bacterium]|nr:OadG family protein [Clostridia bacterium]
MMLNLLSDTLSWGDRLNYMGIGVLLGIVVVFSVLILLWIILEIFGKIAGRGKAAPAPKAEPTPAPAQAPVPVSVPAPAPAAAAPMSDDAIVAAITAALAVYLEAQGPKAPSISGFRVVSFKKVGTAAHWNQN